MVGDNAIQFLRHFSIETSQSSLNMGHGDMQFGRRQSTGKGCIGITVNQDHIRRFLQKNSFDTFQHLTGHGSMREAVDFKLVVWTRNLQLAKKHLTHVIVEMLAGVYNDFVYPVMLIVAFIVLGYGSGDG
jgi:hypothetical protein